MKTEKHSFVGMLFDSKDGIWVVLKLLPAQKKET